MSNEEHSPPNSPQTTRVPRRMSLEQAHKMRQNNPILNLQQRVRQISRQLEQVTAQFTAFQGGRQTQESDNYKDENDYSSDSSLSSHLRKGDRRSLIDEFCDIKLERRSLMATWTPVSILSRFEPWIEFLKPKDMMMRRVLKLLASNSRDIPPCGLRVSRSKGLELARGRSTLRRSSKPLWTSGFYPRVTSKTCTTRFSHSNKTT